MSNPTAEPATRYGFRLKPSDGSHVFEQMEKGEYVTWAAYEFLREILNFPRLTPDARTDQFAAVLRDHDKGEPVNAQDLINALMWRVRNQKREIVRLNEALRRKVSDEAPSFSPNFDERNGL